MPKKSVKRKSKFRKLYRIVYLFCILGIIIAGILVLKNSQSETDCANSISCIEDLSGKIDPLEKTGEFMGQKVSIPSEVRLQSDTKAVLGDSSSNKHIYIDLTSQKLYAKEGDRTVYDFLIS